MENEPINITEHEEDEETLGFERKLTVQIAPGATDVFLREYQGDEMQMVRLSANELVSAFATWYGEKEAADFAVGAMFSDSGYSIGEVDKQAV